MKEKSPLHILNEKDHTDICLNLFIILDIDVHEKFYNQIHVPCLNRYPIMDIGSEYVTMGLL